MLQIALSAINIAMLCGWLAFHIVGRVSPTEAAN